MPTYQARQRFLRDFKSLSREQAAVWEKALDLFIECLRRGSFDPSLRIKRVQGYPGAWEMKWAPTDAPRLNTATSCEPENRTSSGVASVRMASFASHS